MSKISVNKNSTSNVDKLLPVVATSCVAAGLVARRWWRSRKEPPRFSMGLPLIGPILEFVKDPMELMRQGYRKLGGCFKVNFLAMDMVYLVGPEGQEFFFNNDKYLDQAKMYKFTVPIFGRKILYDVDYATRTAQLHFIRQRLTDKFLRTYTQTLEEEVALFFEECWAGKEGVVDIRDSMQELLTRTSIRCLMGQEMRNHMGASKGGFTIVELLHTLEKGMLPFSVFFPSAPIKRHRERDRARRLIFELVKPILDERRASFARGEKSQGDFLQSVLEGTYPDGRKITDEEIVGFLVAAFFGGMHNSSITTSWSTLEIFSRPDLVNELREEQRSTLGSDSGQFTFEGYESMKKLRSTVSEVVRVHPPLFFLMRTVMQDVKFKNFTIRKGNVVAVSPNVSCMLDEVYPNASTFDENRFINGTGDEWAYIPFGGGRRICKGKEFGYMQVMCAMSHMLRHFDVELVDGITKQTPSEDGMVIAMEQPCRVRYKRRAHELEKCIAA